MTTLKRILQYSFVFVLTFFSSCKTYEYFPIMVLEPAEITIPHHFDNVLVAHGLNRTADDTAGTVFKLYGETHNDTAYIYDSLATEAILVLSEVLNNTGRFNATAIDTNITSRYTGHGSLGPDEIESIKKLCQSYDADALILLTSLNCSDSYDINFDDFGHYHGEFEITMAMNWYFIDPYNATIPDTLFLYKTLRFETEPMIVEDTLAFHNVRMEFLLEAVTTNVIQYANRISPYWASTERMVFSTGHRWIRKGYKEAILGNWKQSDSLWQKVMVSEPDQKNRARAAFNLALAAEMDGALEFAITWAEKSYELFPDTLNSTYIAILKKRLAQQYILWDQMEGR